MSNRPKPGRIRAKRVARNKPRRGRGGIPAVAAKDRSLPGKARIRARRLARKAAR